MRELVDYIVSQFVNAEDYEIVILEDDAEVEIKVFVVADKVSKLIGKNGRIAKAIRTIIRAASQKNDKKYNIFIEEK